MSVKGSAESYVELRGSLSLPEAIHGKSAYEIAVMNGFDGTEEEWLEYLRAEALTEANKAKAISEEAAELVDELQERLNAEDFAENEIIRHNNNPEAHKAMLGEGNEKGIKGYWIEAVDTTNNKLRLSNKTVRSSVGKPTITANLSYSATISTGYAVGDEFSVITPKNHFVRCGKITAIQYNLITFEPYMEVAWSAGNPTDNTDYSFSVPLKADTGIVQVFEGGLAEGYHTRAGGDWSHSEGVYSQAVGAYSHAEGLKTGAGYAAHSEGEGTMAVGKYTHAEGFETYADGSGAHAEGNGTKAMDTAAHAEGNGTQALKGYSHAEGLNTITNDNAAHAEGWGSNASGLASHAEGNNTTASKKAAHAEGVGTVAAHLAAHAEGFETEASGNISHSEGWGTKATAECSHAGGRGTIASAIGQTAIGKWNAENPDALLIVGKGTSDTKRSNAFEVLKDGTMLLGGNTFAPNTLTNMVTGSYVGTVSDQETISEVTLNIGFAPKLFILNGVDGWNHPVLHLYDGLSKSITFKVGNESAAYLKTSNCIKVTNNIVTIKSEYPSDNPEYNWLGKTYVYIAIG